MTTNVVMVRPDASVRQIAQLLLAKGISAVPVVDDGGTLIGMVSEGDLIGREALDRKNRKDWWLALLAEGETLSPEFLAYVHAPERAARDIMAAPVISVTEDTDVSQIARVLTTHHIKRVPVLRRGRIIGIVSRADLVRALAHEPPTWPVSAT